MKISILIGFCYDNIEKNKLPGIVIDLYLAYKMSLQMKSDQIIIITDLNKDQNTIILLNAITEGIVDAGILNFIENIKKKNIFNNFRDIILINSNKKSEIFIVMDCCNGSGLWLPYKLENNHYYLNSNYLEN